MVEWKCKNKKCLVRIYENYDGASETPQNGPVKLVESANLVEQKCPRCDEKTGTLAEIKGEQLCPRCISEINVGCDITRRPDGSPRNMVAKTCLSDPQRPPSLHSGSMFEKGCELCHRQGLTLILFEGVFICKGCRQVCEEGEYAVSQVKTGNE